MGFSQWDDEFEKAPSTRKPAAVPDGDYTVEVKVAELRETKAGDVFSIKFTVLDDGPLCGKQLERAVFLAPFGNTEEEKQKSLQLKIGDIKKDLKTIGFDVENWTRANKRPFGAQCDIACKLMRGCKLKVRAKTKDDGYQNVWINKRLEDDKPAKFGAAEMKLPDEEAPFESGPQDSPVPF